MRYSPLLLALVFIGCAPKSFQNRPISPFAVYYGYEDIHKLSSYKLAVIQPWAVTPADVRNLKFDGTMVLGYVSVGEDDELHRDNGKGIGGYASWYIDEYTGDGLITPKADGVPDKNSEWKSYYVNPANPRWQNHIKKKIHSMMKELDLDGVFVDTVLLPRNVFTIDLENKMEQGMIALLRNLKKWTDNGYILINNGWRDYDFIKDKIDGVMIESNDLKEIGRIKHAMDQRSEGKPLHTFALIYLEKTDQDTVFNVCKGLKPLNIKTALYPSDEGGKRLSILPLANCPE